MKKKVKIIIIILIVIAMIISAILFTTKIKKENSENVESDKNKVVKVNTIKEEFVKILEDGTKLNTSAKLKEVKKFEGLEISNLQLTEKDNVTLLLGTITNISETRQGGYPVNIKIIDKDGNQIITIVAIIRELEAGESAQLSTNVTFDCANAYDLIISRR